MPSGVSKSIEEKEIFILRELYKAVISEETVDNSVSESKAVKRAQRQLREALRNTTLRCTCARMKYGICEVCQGSSKEMFALRGFYGVVRNAKRFKMSEKKLQEFIENSKREMVALQS